jgi:hypothetical protein
MGFYILVHDRNIGEFLRLAYKYQGLRSVDLTSTTHHLSTFVPQYCCLGKT